jgi:hypothetical protein
VLGITLTAPAASPASAAAPAAVAAGSPTQVLGVQLERGAVGAAGAANGTPTSALGVSAAGETLARTGFALGLFALFGLALVAIGSGLRRLGRR